jgi:hypothetical protein
MFRKLILALGAVVTLSAAALAPTSASAWGGGWHGHHGWHGGWHGARIGFYGPTYVTGPDCYIVKRVVETPYGPRLRRVTVCN